MAGTKLVGVEPSCAIGAGPSRAITKYHGPGEWLTKPESVTGLPQYAACWAADDEAMGELRL